MTHYADAYVKAGKTTQAPCPNDDSLALSAPWIAIAEGETPATLTVGHMVACPACRPDGMWSCEFCGDLIPLNGEQIYAHVRACMEVTYG